jgi:hypothetical protein
VVLAIREVSPARQVRETGVADTVVVNRHDVHVDLTPSGIAQNVVALPPSR